MEKHRIYRMSFASVYPHYLQKAEKKGRTKQEVDEVICWLTGYSRRELAAQIRKKQDVEHPLMRKIRYMDKLVDELARGRAMEKILRA